MLGKKNGNHIRLVAILIQVGFVHSRTASIKQPSHIKLIDVPVELQLNTIFVNDDCNQILRNRHNVFLVPNRIDMLVFSLTEISEKCDQFFFLPVMRQISKRKRRKNWDENRKENLWAIRINEEEWWTRNNRQINDIRNGKYQVKFIQPRGMDGSGCKGYEWNGYEVLRDGERWWRDGLLGDRLLQ